MIPSSSGASLRDTSSPGERRLLPLPRLAPDAVASAAVYGMAAVDCRGRVADRAVITSLGWTPGLRLSIREDAGLVLLVADPRGVFSLTRQGHLRLPVGVRRGVRWGRAIGCCWSPIWIAASSRGLYGWDDPCSRWLSRWVFHPKHIERAVEFERKEPIVFRQIGVVRDRVDRVGRYIDGRAVSPVDATLGLGLVELHAQLPAFDELQVVQRHTLLPAA